MPLDRTASACTSACWYSSAACIATFATVPFLRRSALHCFHHEVSHTLLLIHVVVVKHSMPACAVFARTHDGFLPSDFLSLSEAQSPERPDNLFVQVCRRDLFIIIITITTNLAAGRPLPLCLAVQLAREDFEHAGSGLERCEGSADPGFVCAAGGRSDRCVYVSESVEGVEAFFGEGAWAARGRGRRSGGGETGTGRDDGGSGGVPRKGEV